MRPRTALVASLIVAGTLVSGCTPRQSAMPMLVSLVAEGRVEVYAPLCAGDEVTFAALFVPGGVGHIEHRGGGDSVSRVVEFSLSAEAIRDGSLTDDVPVTRFQPYRTAPAGYAELGRFHLGTVDYRADVDFDPGLFDAGSELLVFGVQGVDDDAYISPVTRVAGEEVIETWCDEQGA